MEQILNILLLYSLGFGLVLAVLTGLTLALTRSSSPLLRYRILVTLLGLFTAGIAVTGFLKLSVTDQNGSVAIQIHGPVTNSSVQQTSISSATSDLIALSKNFMNHNARTIALIWALIVLVKCIKLGSNLFELHYLKTRQVYPAGKHWEDEVARLSRKIGLNKAVRVLQSGITQVPLVIGHIKPVILIPLGMITAIKPQELEMMLLHELAHIKRLDFLVNILQHALELLFFFNPAVLWISALIRKERENCCDEMVLQHSSEKQSYIQALLSFREYQLNVPAYAMAFAKESNLITRVKRMVYQKNTALSSIEKGGLLIAVIMLCSFSVLRSSRAADYKVARFQEPVVKKKKNAEKAVPPAPVAPLPPPAPPKKKSILAPVKPGAPVPPTAPQTSITMDDINNPGVSVSVNSNVNSNIHMQRDSNLHVSYSVHLDPQSKIDTQPGLNPDSRVRLNAQSKHVTLSKLDVKSSDLTEELISALEKAGVSTKGENFVFHLSNKELVVNGKKQSDEILRAVLKGFIKSPEDTIDFWYNRKNNNINTSSNYYRK
jgi:bla regulator protein BlaR1